MNGRRLVAVLGYSDRTTPGLHEVCAARLEQAAGEVRPGDTVLLSGWARTRRRRSEATLMAQAWSGLADRVVLDEGARTTHGNTRRAAAVASELGVDQIVVVTSGWHARRAGALARAALRGSGRTVTVVATHERGTWRSRARELACWPGVPFQIALAARKR
jgi:uncharacterized SAM-binding protein YcdF (DUF218 family)